MPRYSFNVFTGNFDAVGSSSGGGGADYYVELFELSSAEITAGSITLATAPTNPSRTILIIKEGVGQYYGDDYQVSGTTLSWGGLGLDGVLSAGDKISILHN